LEVVRLQCPACSTSIEGRFSLGRFQSLSPEQFQFVETFIRCRGVIKDVEEQLGISYPTVRGKLDAVIRALGYTVPDDSSPIDRRQVFEDIKVGKITPEEGERLLRTTSMRKGA
jgi:hypothetical protein